MNSNNSSSNNSSSNNSSSSSNNNSNSNSSMNGDSPVNDGQMQDAWFDNCLSPAASNLSFMLTSPCASRLTPTQGEVGIGTPLSDTHNMLKNDSFATHFSPSIFSPSKKISKLVKKRATSSSSSSRPRNTVKNNKKMLQSEQFPIL